MPTYAVLPVWTDDQLEQGRQAAIDNFIQERMAQGDPIYAQTLKDAVGEVEALFAATNDLRSLAGGAALAARPSLLAVARYLGGPPISEDDLDTLGRVRVSKRKRLTKDEAAAAAVIVEALIDRTRCPWLFGASTPNAAELEAQVRSARVATATLMAAQRYTTHRRGASSVRQQTAVERTLTQERVGFMVRPEVRELTLPATELSAGEFSREADVDGAKADVPVKLRNEQLLLIECKVSNSSVNSHKRLIRETVGKADRWRTSFGARALTAAVLAGVFTLRDLQRAQRSGVGVFWEHDLEQLAEFVLSTAPL
jgi:XamI restriction endonuclease